MTNKEVSRKDLPSHKNASVIIGKTCNNLCYLFSSKNLARFHKTYPCNFWYDNICSMKFLELSNHLNLKVKGICYSVKNGLAGYLPY